MATIVTNTSQGPLQLPAVYGGAWMAPSAEVIIADTPTNVAAGLGSPPTSVFSLASTSDGQQGAITPNGGGAAGGIGYTPATPGNWDTVPTTVSGALNDIAIAGGAGGAALSGVLAGTLPAPTLAAGGVVTASLADAAVTTLKIADVNVTTGKLADGAVTFAKSKMFVSSEQTGTGSSQSIAHGLGVAPAANVFTVTDDTAAQVTGYAIVQGTNTSSNVVVTVTSGVKFKVVAWA